jgi:hypothetical protein
LTLAEDIEKRLEEAFERDLNSEPGTIQTIINNFSQDISDAQIIA